MNKNIISIITLLTLLFCGVNSVFSQEWEVEYHYLKNNDFAYEYDEAIELSNGNVLVTSMYCLQNKNGDYVSTQPALSLISSEGVELCRKEFIRPGLCEITRPYLFEKNGNMYMLTSYGPDHDINSDNYFKNFNNPVSDAVLGLYKLDENLDITESYEQILPVDTFEYRKSIEWQSLPNYYSGYVYIYSAIETDGNIAGSYIKSVSYSNEVRGNDTIFFFKMDFEGNLIVKKGYEAPQSGGAPFSYRRQHMVKSDNGYIVYYRGFEIDKHGTIEYYDNDFNRIDTRYVIMPGHDPYYDNNFKELSVFRSRHNTTYVATRSKSLKLNSDDNVRLYEFDDKLENSTDVLPVLHYVERGSNDIDRNPYRAIDVTSEGDIYFAYTLKFGSMTWGDSWVMIEKLNSDFDTISTLFYDDGQHIHTQVSHIATAKDDGLIAVFQSKKIDDMNNRWSKVSKFPASAFGIDNIEEAHAHNLHLAVAYPNPGGDVMNIRTGLRNAVLSVYDLQGRKIHEQEITDDITSVDASGWQSGTYIWKLGMRNEELGMKEVESGKWVK